MSPLAPGLVLERDESAVEGRPKRSGETYYIVPGVQIGAVSTTGLSNDIDVYTGWFNRTPIVIDQLAFEVSGSSAGNARCGFYRADRDWQPIGAPLADSGDISTGTTGVKTYTPSTPIIVRPGRYLSVINASATPTVRVFRGSSPGAIIQSELGASLFVTAVSVSRSYAAFPTPGTAWTTDAASGNLGWFNIVVYRVLTP